jgi:hypothetical protein
MYRSVSWCIASCSSAVWSPSVAAGVGVKSASAASTPSSQARAKARTSSRDGQIVAAPLRGTAAASESGSMPRSKSDSSRVSIDGRPRPRRRNASTLNAGRWPS